MSFLRLHIDLQLTTAGSWRVAWKLGWILPGILSEERPCALRSEPASDFLVTTRPVVSNSVCI